MGMAYADADQVLHRLIDLQLPPEQIINQGFASALVDKINTMVQASAHKRCLPPACMSL